MKRLLLSILISLSALAAFGQEKDDSVNQRYFDAKIKEFVYRLDLSDQQKALFIPIYERYSNEMRANVGERRRPKTKPETAEEAAAIAKAKIERQQKAQDIRLKYVDEFAKVLNPDQLGRLYDVENQIQRKLMSRKGTHGKDGGHRPGHRPTRAPKGPRTSDKK